MRMERAAALFLMELGAGFTVCMGRAAAGAWDAL